MLLGHAIGIKSNLFPEPTGFKALKSPALVRKGVIQFDPSVEPLRWVRGGAPSDLVGPGRPAPFVEATVGRKHGVFRVQGHVIQLGPGGHDGMPMSEFRRRCSCGRGDGKWLSQGAQWEHEHRCETSEPKRMGGVGHWGELACRRYGEALGNNSFTPS